MTAAAHPGDHAPVIPPIEGQSIGKPLCCAKCGHVLHLVCGDAPAATGTPAKVDRVPDPAPPAPQRPPSERKAAATRARWAAGFRFKPKLCQRCGAQFTPTGAAQKFCGCQRGAA